MTPEFHADLQFWNMVVVRARTIGGGSLEPPLHSFCIFSHFRTPWFRMHPSLVFLCFRSAYKEEYPESRVGGQ